MLKAALVYALIGLLVLAEYKLLKWLDRNKII